MFNYINKFNLTFIKKDNYLTMYIVFAYTLLFFSIGENIVNIEFNKNLLKIENILFIRSISPYLILFINFLIILKLKNFIFLKFNIVIIFFFLMIICQALGLYFSVDRSYLGLIHFLLGSLSTLTTFIIIISLDKKKIMKLVLFTTIFLIFLIVFIFIYQNPNIKYGGGSVYIFEKKIYFLNSNGFSRYLVFIYIVILSKYLLQDNTFNIKFLLPIIIILSLIYAYEGRVNIASILIINLFIFFYKNNFKKKVLIFIILVFTPYFTSNFILNYKNQITKIDIPNINKFNTYNIITDKKTNRVSKIEHNDPKLFNYLKDITANKNDFSTGRTDKWISILNYNQNFTNSFFGNGPEFDRALLKDRFEYAGGDDAANSLLYFYLCGGYLSLIIVFLFGGYQLILFYFALIDLKNEKDIYFLISIKIFIFIIMRSFFENSYASWSIDQILFILTCVYWNMNINKKKIPSYLNKFTIRRRKNF